MPTPSLQNVLHGAFASLLAGAALAAPEKRLDNGLALTPPMGWNSYNHYSCHPNQSIIESNAKALVDFGLADLGYTYVTTDCGWTIPERSADSTLTWNATTFPDGFPALGEYIHALGLHFGVYSDSGVQMCMTGQPNQTGSLYHEALDAQTFASWGADLLKYDNCYSSEDKGYPNTDYTPSTSPAPRFATMREALAATGRDILYQICEWGIDFPSAWAPELGNTWRMSNDIIPAWQTIYRIMNQFVPSAGYAGPGQWPDLDMLEVGNDIFTEAEEQTHFTLWALAKSPLVIGGALNDTLTSIKPSSLAVLSNTNVISFNQDSLGKAVSLSRRYTEEGLDICTGPLSGGRTVAALVNWTNHTVNGTLYLPDVGLQSAGMVKDIWNNQTHENVVTSFSAKIAAHGTLLVELSDTSLAGTYSVVQCGRTHQGGVTFDKVYGRTDSDAYTVTVNFADPVGRKERVAISSSASSGPVGAHVGHGVKSFSAKVSLSAGLNTLTFHTHAAISSINISPPESTFYPSTAFTVNGTATHITCPSGLCLPTGSKITNLTASGYASITLPASSGMSNRYVELIYTNNDVALDTAWTNGTNSRNITVQVNNAPTVRLDVPLSGRSSELFSPMGGWGDSAELGVLVGGFGTGGKMGDKVVVGNNAKGDGAHFVGMRVY